MYDKPFISLPLYITQKINQASCIAAYKVYLASSKCNMGLGRGIVTFQAPPSYPPCLLQLIINTPRLPNGHGIILQNIGLWSLLVLHKSTMGCPHRPYTKTYIRFIRTTYTRLRCLRIESQVMKTRNKSCTEKEYRQKEPCPSKKNFFLIDDEEPNGQSTEDSFQCGHKNTSI